MNGKFYFSAVGDSLVETVKLQTLSRHEERVWCVSWNNAGTILASCGEDKSVRLWVTEGPTWICAFSSTFDHVRTVRHVSWAPNDRYLAAASFDSTVSICRVEVTDGVIDLLSIAVLEGHTSEVKCVAWSPSGYLLSTCGRDKSVWIWEFDDEEDFQCVSVLQPHTGDVKYVFWHPIKEQVFIWLKRQLPRHLYSSPTLTFYQILGSASYDNTINLYKEELDDWAVACKLVGHESTVWKAEFSPNGHILASVSEDTTIKLWHELPSETSLHWVCFKTLAGYHTAPVFGLTWTPCGHYLATCGGDDSVFVFRINLASGNLVGETSTEDVVVWQHLSKVHGCDVNCVSWRPKICMSQGPDRRAWCLLATAGDDRQVNLWKFLLDSESADLALRTQPENDEFDVD
ncbi:unnamed protein product [Hydatigera taeniaeformis]|uniref:Probable cytosolic iron-sulfur protein assembly protein CIAO1 homolog n=1 Tax=Hydatigena taeniaeformis TaxID=6205 RepID=A0A0R3X4F6_HYDTA|nr:unnamed protein product [Hydatigera taeniaeformis]